MLCETDAATPSISSFLRTFMGPDLVIESPHFMRQRLKYPQESPQKLENH